MRKTSFTDLRLSFQHQGLHTINLINQIKQVF